MAPDPPKREGLPSYQEVESVVSELKRDRDVGVCGVTAELLKVGREGMKWWLHAAIVYKCGSPMLYSQTGEEV